MVGVVSDPLHIKNFSETLRHDIETPFCPNRPMSASSNRLRRSESVLGRDLLPCSKRRVKIPLQGKAARLGSRSKISFTQAHRTLRAIAIAVLSLTIISPAKGTPNQERGIPETPAFLLTKAGYAIDSWSAEDGYPLQGVRSLAQTPDGYLWCGVESALLRFDGVNFTKFDSKEIPVLEGASMLDLFCDSKGRLWIGGGADWVLLYENTTFRRVNIRGWSKEMIPGRWGFNESPEGEIWVYRPGALLSQNLAHYRHGQFENVENSVPFRAEHFFPERQDRQWIRPMGEPLLVEHTKNTSKTIQLTRADGLPEETIGRFFRSRTGELSVTAATGVYSLRDGGWQLRRQFPQPLEGKPIFDSCEDVKGNIWIGGRGKIYLNQRSGHLQRIAIQELADLDIVLSIIEAKDGSIWVAAGSTLHRITPLVFQSWGANHGLVGGRCISVVEDNQHKIWVTNPSVLCSIDEGSLDQIEILPEPMRHWQAIPSESGDLFVSKYTSPSLQGDWVIERWADGKKQPVANGTKEITSMVETSTSELWVATRKGLMRYRNGQPTPVAPLETGLGEGVVMELAEDKEGRLLVAVEGRGLMRSTKGGWQQLTTSSDQGSDTIVAIHIDHQDVIWLACHHSGLAYLHHGVWYSFKDSPHLPAAVWAVTTDFIGGVWVASNRGVIRLERRDLLRRDKIAKVESVSFDRSDGLLSNRTTGRHTGLLCASDGTIWISTALGVSSVTQNDLERHLNKKFEAPIYIERVVVDDNLTWHRDRQNTEPFVVAPGGRRIEFHYTSVDPGGSGKDRFLHRVLGYDENWVSSGENRTAVYQRLPPGSYRFEVAVSDRDEEEKIVRSSINFVVAPHWWQLAWVRLVALVAGIAVVSLLVRWRFRIVARRQARQEAFSRELLSLQEAERKRVAAELHDGLGQNLVLVSKGIKEVGEDDRADNNLRKTLSGIHNIVAQSVEEVRSISHNLHPFKLERLGLTTTLRATVRQVSEISGLNIVSRIENIDDTFSETAEINIYRIVQEAMNNAIKHSHASKIEVSAKRERDFVVLEVEDNGCGFEIEENYRHGSPAKRGFGLTGMEERTRIIGGKIYFLSTPGQGTRLRLEIPVPEKQTVPSHSHNGSSP